MVVVFILSEVVVVPKCISSLLLLVGAIIAFAYPITAWEYISRNERDNRSIRAWEAEHLIALNRAVAVAHFEVQKASVERRGPGLNNHVLVVTIILDQKTSEQMTVDIPCEFTLAREREHQFNTVITYLSFPHAEYVETNDPTSSNCRYYGLRLHPELGYETFSLFASPRSK